MTTLRQFAADHSANAGRLVNDRPPRLYDDDPLAAARGIVNGLALSALLWALVALVWWLA